MIFQRTKSIVLFKILLLILSSYLFIGCGAECTDDADCQDGYYCTSSSWGKCRQKNPSSNTKKDVWYHDSSSESGTSTKEEPSAHSDSADNSSSTSNETPSDSKSSFPIDRYFRCYFHIIHPGESDWEPLSGVGLSRDRKFKPHIKSILPLQLELCN